MEQHDVGIFIGKTHVSTFTPVPVEISVTKAHLKMEFYMRRKNKIYLRSGKRKLTVELTEIPVDVADLKYGTMLDCNFVISEE